MSKQEKIAVIRPHAAELGLKSSQLNQMTPEQLDEQFVKAQALAAAKAKTAEADAPTGQSTPAVTTTVDANGVFELESGETIPVLNGVVLFAPNGGSSRAFQVSIGGAIVHVPVKNDAQLLLLQAGEDAIQVGQEVVLRATGLWENGGKTFGRFLAAANPALKNMYGAREEKRSRVMLVRAQMIQQGVSAAVADEMIQGKQKDNAAKLLDLL